MPQSRLWMAIAELVALAAAVGGLGLVLASHSVLHAVVPLTVALVLNWFNRRSQEQLTRRDTTVIMSQMRRQIMGQLRSLGSPSEPKQLPPATEKGDRAEVSPKIAEIELRSLHQRYQDLQERAIALEDSLTQVVDYLNRMLPPGKIERWDQAFASLKGELPDNAPAEMPALQHPQISHPEPEDSALPLCPATPWTTWLSLPGHAGWVSTVTVSPDGKLLVSASYDQTLKVWHLETGELRQILTGHRGAVSAIAFSPDGSVLASASFDRNIGLWDAATGDGLGSWEAHMGSVRAIAFSPDGSLLVSGGFDGTVSFWEWHTGAQLHSHLGHTGSVRSLVFGGDGQTLFSSGEDGLIQQWDVATGECIGTVGEDVGAAPAIALHPTRPILASGSSDHTVKLWSLDEQPNLPPLEGHTAPVTAIAFSRDGEFLVSASTDGTLRLWHLPSQDCCGVLVQDGSPILSVAIAPDQRHLISGTVNGLIHLWQAVQPPPEDSKPSS